MVCAVCIAGLTGSQFSGSWTRLTPSVALVAIERHAPTRFARPARREVFRRLDVHELAGFEVSPVCALLIADLANDERNMNATHALERLRVLWPRSRPALEAALASRDRQTRYLAAEVLRDTLAANPPDALLHVCVENLAEERGGALAWYLSWGKVSTAAHFLIEHIDRAEPLLDRAMRDGDPQQRLIAAAIIAECPRRGGLHLAVPILLEHLRDNDIEGDAQIAVPALLAAGERITPWLEPFRHDEDTQRRQLVRALLAHYGHPTDPAQPEFDHPPRITTLGHDALTLPPLSQQSGIRLYWP